MVLARRRLRLYVGMITERSITVHDSGSEGGYSGFESSQKYDTGGDGLCNNGNDLGCWSRSTRPGSSKGTVIKSFLKKQGYVTGFHPRVLQRSLQGLPSFIAGWLRYKKLNQGSGFRLAMADAFPILTDRFDSAGLADGHYFHQDLWAARKIHRA